MLRNMYYFYEIGKLVKVESFMVITFLLAVYKNVKIQHL